MNNQDFNNSLSSLVASFQQIAALSEAKKAAPEALRKAKEQSFNSVKSIISFAIAKNNDTPLAQIAATLAEFEEFRKLLPAFREVLTYSVKTKAFKRTMYAKKAAAQAAEEIATTVNPFNADVIAEKKAERVEAKKSAPESVKLTDFLKKLEAAAKVVVGDYGHTLQTMIDSVHASIEAAQEKEKAESLALVAMHNEAPVLSTITESEEIAA